MKWKCPVAVAVWGLFCGGIVLAEGTSTSPAQQAAEAEAAVDQAKAAETPFEEEPEVAPVPEGAAPMADDTQPPPDEAYDSPSDSPPPETPHEAGNAWVLDSSDPAPSGNSCSPSCGRHPTCCGPFTTSTSCGRQSCGTCCGLGGLGGCGGITIGGWLDQGITVNGRLVADRFNGPVGYNDRDAEYQMNQLYLFLEKPVDTRGGRIDVGGRVDAVYGTDWRYVRSYGLERTWNESERFYGLALPQMYMDVGVGDLTVRMGHYYTILGYEVATAPDNFFYSHSYALLYGEPLTHTGLLASCALGNELAVSAGFDRGWDMWEDENHHLAFLGGISWQRTVCDESTSLAFAISSGPYDGEGQFNRTMYSLVFSRQVGPLKYVLQHNYGMDDCGGYLTMAGTIRDAEWYGINQYLLYDVNKYWGLGLRIEWFRDDDGVRVGGMGAPRGWDLGPNRAANHPGWAGNFTALTLGVNWRPTQRISVRPECRWDWYRGRDDGLGRLPYDTGTRRNQFTFATDVVFVF